ncbi:MAG: fadK [Pseudonocardiales bacterium]|nr:fadK [Pseudonocardiales bacterium]
MTTQYALTLPARLARREAAADRTWRDGSAEPWHGRATLGQAFAAGVAANPSDRLIFASESHPSEMTLAGLAAESGVVADALYALGLRRGDVLAAQVPQWAEQLTLWFAASQLGLVYLPIIHIYGVAELQYILRDSGAKALILPDRWRSIDYRERLDGLDVPGLEHVVVIGDPGRSGALVWDDLIGRARHGGGQRLGGPDADVAPTDPCLLLYTSGTTSNPKGVVHTSDSFLAEGWTSYPILYRGPQSVTLDVSPAGHMASIIGVTRPLLTHANRTVFMDVWNADHALELVGRHGVTASGGPPFFLTTLLDAAGDDRRVLSSITNWMLGGSAVPVPLSERAEAGGVHTYRCYGSTEHPTVSTGWLTDTMEQRTRTDGRLLPGTQVRIVDEDEREVPLGQEGEIRTVGPEQMAGYTDADATRAAFDDQGYFRTGDLGVLRPDGQLQVTGRKKDIIIRGGENLSALEIEEILMRHPAVKEVAAVAVADKIYTERVCVVVALESGASLTLADVQAHFSRSGVAKQKTPERLVLVDALPHTATGKVKKQELRESLEST